MLQDSFENPEQNILRFKSKIVEEYQKVPTENKEAQEMKIQGITIYRQKNCDTWYARYSSNGKRYFVSGKTQKEVAEKLKDALDVKRKENLPYTTFEKWYKQWLKLFKIGNVKATTIADYEKSLKHIPKNIYEKNIKNITSLDILELLNEIETPRTKQKVYEFLKELFTKAKNFSVIRSNPIDVIERPKYKRSEGIALDSDQQKTFIDLCLKNKYGDMFLIALFEGLRIGEVLAITGNDLDLEHKIIKINKSLDRKSNFDTTKNKQSEREVPIFDNCFSILKKYTSLGNERVFNIGYGSVQKILKKIISEENLPDISCHDLRHTFITNCKNAEIPEHIVQSWVGHEIGSSVTKKVYTHITKDANLFINKLNAENYTRIIPGNKK